MFFRHSFDKLIFLPIALVLVIVLCYRPKYHLRSEMPPGFFSAGTAESAPKNSMEEKVAWAYWESAQMDVQWKYPHDHPLPTDPPPEFRISAQALGPEALDPATRFRYWRRLQGVWYLPETWQKDYEWDWGWASDPLTSGGQWIRDRVGHLFSGP